MIKTPICDMLGIQYPIFQGGMAWIADGRLAAAVSEGGGLGIISAMNAGPDYLKKEIDICRNLTNRPFGVNVMPMSPSCGGSGKAAGGRKGTGDYDRRRESWQIYEAVAGIRYPRDPGSGARWPWPSW